MQDFYCIFYIYITFKTQIYGLNNNLLLVGQKKVRKICGLLSRIYTIPNQLNSNAARIISIM